MHDVACVHVRLVGDLARDRDEEAALDVHDALRLARRAGGVRQQVRRLGVDLSGGQHAGQAVELERRDDDVLDARRFAACLVEDLEHRHGLAPARRGDLRDHDLRLAGLEALRDGRRGEAGEDRYLDGAEVGDRVRGDGHLGRHRQEDRDAVAGPDAESGEALGEPGDVARQLRERDHAPGAVLAEADRGDALRRRRGPAVDAVVRDGHLAADEPGRPLRAARGVEHLSPRLGELETEILDDERPEPLRLLGGAPDERRIVGDAGPREQARDVRARSGGSVGAPDDLGHAAHSTSGW